MRDLVNKIQQISLVDWSNESITAHKFQESNFGSFHQMPPNLIPSKSDEF